MPTRQTSGKPVIEGRLPVLTGEVSNNDFSVGTKKSLIRIGCLRAVVAQGGSTEFYAQTRTFKPHNVIHVALIIRE